MVQTNQSHVEHKGTPQIDGETCSTSKILGQRRCIVVTIFFVMNWAERKSCQCCEVEGTEKHKLHHCKKWRGKKQKNDML